MTTSWWIRRSPYRQDAKTQRKNRVVKLAGELVVDRAQNGSGHEAHQEAVDETQDAAQKGNGIAGKELAEQSQVRSGVGSTLDHQPDSRHKKPDSEEESKNEADRRGVQTHGHSLD